MKVWKRVQLYLFGLVVLARLIKLINTDIFFLQFKKICIILSQFDCRVLKELSLCHKLKFSNPYIYGTWCCRLLILQTKIIWSNRIHSLKYLWSTTLESKDIGFRKADFVAKTQFLLLIFMISYTYTFTMSGNRLFSVYLSSCFTY